MAFAAGIGVDGLTSGSADAAAVDIDGIEAVRKPISFTFQSSGRFRALVTTGRLSRSEQISGCGTGWSSGDARVENKAQSTVANLDCCRSAGIEAK